MKYNEQIKSINNKIKALKNELKKAEQEKQSLKNTFALSVLWEQNK